MNDIYYPDEDSFLLSESIKSKISRPLLRNKNLKFLEIGCGSGFQIENLISIGIKKENILGCDINENAVKICKSKGFNCILSNLFEKINGKFDIIIFNPPYLPEDSREPLDSRISTTGGKKGSELINKFLKESKFYLKKNGRIFLVTSSLTKGINWNNFKKRKIAEKKLFFEKIYVWELKP